MIDVEKLRRDYMTVTTWLVDCGEWSVAESQEVGQAIKTALDEQDSGYLAFWADWLGLYAGLYQAGRAEQARLDQAACVWAAEQHRMAA